MKKRFTAHPVYAASLEELGRDNFYSYDYAYDWFEDTLNIPQDPAKVLARWYNEELPKFKTKEEFVQYLQSSDFLDSLEARDLAVPRYEQTIIKRAIKKIVAANVLDYAWIKDALQISDEVAKILAKWFTEDYDMSKDEFIDYVKHDSDFKEDIKEYSAEEQAIVRQALKDVRNLAESESFDEDEILEMAQMHFEQGTYFEVEDFDGDEDAYREYAELVDLGPVGFYEEYKDKLDFDEDFVREYGQYYDDEE